MIEVLDTDITKLEAERSRTRRTRRFDTVAGWRAVVRRRRWCAPATASSLRDADELGARSLALVAFGPGVAGFSLEDAAKIEIDEVCQYLSAGGSAIERVVFAVRGSDARAAFEAALAGRS